MRAWPALIVLALMFVLAAPASASTETLVVSSTPFSATEGQQLSSTTVATFFDSVPDDTASNYTASVNWGDGSTSAGTVSGTADTAGPWTVKGTHTYAEEGTYLVVVTVTDAAGATGATASFVATVADAPLSLPAGTPTQTTGSGSAGTASALSSFEASIGGPDNGTVAGEQTGGYRHLTWDAVKLDGSDPGSKTITAGHVVAIATNRVQPWGLQLTRSGAVANDGFNSVNSGTAGRLTPYSSPNIFAPFNSNHIALSVVSPASQGSGTFAAATRGLGIVFLNVWQANTTSVEYFSGSTLLSTAFAPVGGIDQPSFVGELFSSPVVTQVVINLGTAAIFSFDGSTVTSGPPDSQGAGTNLVAADDVVLAEPANGQTALQGTAGVPVSGVLDSFTDTDPSGKASDYSAVVNWGDQSQSNAPVSGPPGGIFSVSGSHTYSKAGSYQVMVTVTDYGGSTQTGHLTIVVGSNPTATSVSCSPAPDAVGNPATCTATVTDTGPGGAVTPTGLVGFSSPTGGTTFSNDTGCGLAPTGVPGQASCTARFTPGHLPPTTAEVVANYQGDPAHSPSKGSQTISVVPQRCTLKLPSKKISPHATRLKVTVDCNFQASLTVKAFGMVSGQPHSKVPFARDYPTVAANQRTKLEMLIHKRTLKYLVKQAHKGRKISLRITLLANATTKPVRAKPVVAKVKF